MATSLETVLECTDVDTMVDFFTAQLGCRLELVTPADDPREFVVSSNGSRIRLVRSPRDVPGRLRFVGSATAAASGGAASRIAPNGTVIEFAPTSDLLDVPDNCPSLSVVRSTVDQAFGDGRAGMGYRDLLPDRWGGRFIASHINIAEGGDVADYVHFHRIRFQMIFVAAGWVEVVYEDQGPPFRMVAGDCVVQPPEIRHRVLRSSPGLEVIEIGCPAEHDTLVDHEMTLPTPTERSDRSFGGQRFTRHVAASTPPTMSVTPGFVERDTGIAAATGGLADARVLTVGPGDGVVDGVEASALTHDGEFAMYVVLAGTAVLAIDHDDVHRVEQVGPRDAVALPPGCLWSWSDRSDDLEVLQVGLPAGSLRPVKGARHAS